MDISVRELTKVTTSRMMITVSELSQGELQVEGRLIDASNATLFGYVVSSIQGKVPVVYKPIAGERPLWDFPEGSLAAREVAAYELSEGLDFNCVPTTVLREGPFGIGAVQQWIDTPEDVDVISIAQKKSPVVRNLALFDALINNTDRKFGHILITAQGRLLGCDHGLTFHEEFKLRTVLWQFAGDELNEKEKIQLKGLEEWIEREESTSFRKHLMDSEIEALLQRGRKILMEGFPMPSTQWPAVPWPPV